MGEGGVELGCPAKPLSAIVGASDVSQDRGLISEQHSNLSGC